MIKNIIAAAAIILLGSATTVHAQKKTKPNPKFIDDIELSFGPATMASTNGPKVEFIEPLPIEKITAYMGEVAALEKLSSLQIKYALLLDTELEQIENENLFSLIDDWFGTPYRYGGSSKSGVDCSAFVQTLYSGIYGMNLPRTAKEQYKACAQISRTEITEGDLVFFNTTGGVSHVGYYLQNNKFVHAASSGGVMISDLDDDYWVKRFIGVGRLEGINTAPIFSKP